jgi:hypothetical protein
MKTIRVHLVLVPAVLLFSSLPSLAGKTAQVPEVIVVTTVHGTGALEDPTVPNYRLQSDLLGDYFHNVDQVVSHLQGGALGSGAGDWEMTTTSSNVRSVMVDLREPYDGVNPPISYSLEPSRFIVKCHVVTPASIGGMKGLNSTLVCPMIFSFFIGRDKYILDMNRGEFPDTNDVLVTCTQVSGDPSDPYAPCTAWTVDPSVTDATGPSNLARLLFSAKGGKLEDRGRYYMRFHISFHE